MMNYRITIELETKHKQDEIGRLFEGLISQNGFSNGDRIEPMLRYLAIEVIDKVLIKRHRLDIDKVA